MGSFVIRKCKTLDELITEYVALYGKDMLLVFPTNHKKNSTVRILKTPKTESSVRKIFLPKSVANMLVDWKTEQDEMSIFIVHMDILSPSNLLRSPSFDDRMMEINLK